MSISYEAQAAGRRDEVLTEAKAVMASAQPVMAQRLLDEALGWAPDDAELHRLRGIAAQMGGDGEQACEHLRRALALRPDDAATHMNLGSVLCEAGMFDEALSLLHRACNLAPDLAAAWFNYGKGLKAQMRYAAACAALEQALELAPTHIPARLALAHAQVSLGGVAAAITNYREVLRHQPDDVAAWFALANLKTVRMHEDDAAALDAVLSQPGLGEAARVSLGFALAKAREDRGDFPEAFAALRAANRQQRARQPWDAAAERTRVAAIMAAFEHAAPEPLDRTLGREVILIVSLPRSGSTLTEQILASHPQVEGANEITDLPDILDAESRRRGLPFPAWVPMASADDWARLGREYLARTARWRQQRPRFTDKNLVTWQLVGAALRMLPGARVVNSRRDALETCASCYRQLFSTGNAFSYDLADMADYCADYHQLSDHWRRLFPGQVFDHAYEDLLAHPEQQIRRLLDFCGLPFDPACLDFQHTQRAVLSTASAAQVRQPLHREASHATHYRAELAPLRARLLAAGLLHA